MLADGHTKFANLGQLGTFKPLRAKRYKGEKDQHPDVEASPPGIRLLDLLGLTRSKQATDP
jgi:hypothetical protein